MQEFQHPNGSRAIDVLYGETVEKLRQKMADNEAMRTEQGFEKVAERKLTKNSKCTCGSGRAIKRCCKFIR